MSSTRMRFFYIWTSLEIVATVAPPNVKAQPGAPLGREERDGRWKPAGARNVGHFRRVSGSYSCAPRGPVGGRQVPIPCPVGRIEHGRTENLRETSALKRVYER